MSASTHWVTSVDAAHTVHVRAWLAIGLDDLLSSHDEMFPGEHVLAVSGERPVESDLQISVSVKRERFGHAG